MQVLMPIKTGRGLNDRMHWSMRHRLAVKQRRDACLLCPPHPLPCVVTMTRLSAGTLDDDNLRGSLKAVVDGIADRLGVDDASPLVEWRYAQRKVKRGHYGVEVQLEAR
jgi:hypothetical protein